MAAGAGCERGVRHGAVARLVAVLAGLVAAAGSRPTGAGAAAAGTGTTDRTRTTAGTGTTEGSDTTDSEPTSELAFIPGPATTQPVLLRLLGPAEVSSVLAAPADPAATPAEVAATPAEVAAPPAPPEGPTDGTPVT
ncbi:MAG: hypothetical protein ACK5CE_01415, partial [Actinomycetes bacterium]